MKKIDMSKVKSITLKSVLGGSDPPTIKMAPRVDGWSTDFDESTATPDTAAWSADIAQNGYPI